MPGTILVVDDDEDGRFLVAGILAGQGYVLEWACNGLAALQMAERVLPDLILLDVMMPGIDGLEVCKRIRSNDRICDVPIIMLTALDGMEEMLKGLEAGADDYITKPFNSIELRARLATITRLNRHRKRLEDRENLAKAHEMLLGAYDATIQGWARALELRDKETEGHSQRVTILCERLARVCGVSNEQIVHIRRGALLHDIGKLGVPDSILHKPGKLTDSEWEIMHKHPQYAFDMLHPIDYLQPAVPIPLCHHEKWDGSGYPQGLKGEDIPLEARMFAIVDVWDALTSERPYRKAWTIEQSMEYLNAQAGKHFDAALLPLFTKIIEEK